MQLWIHIVLLLGVLATPVVLGGIYRQGPSRPVSAFWSAFWPFLILAVLSCLTVSIYGKPFNEWLLPVLAALALVIFCRDDRAYRIGWWALFGTSALLCVNIMLMFGDRHYVRDKYWGERFANIQSNFARNEAQESLAKAFREGDEFEEGPVSIMLNEPRYDNLEIWTPEMEWHTGLTWLWVLKKDKAILWYPGGAIDSGRRNLQFRNVAD